METQVQQSQPQPQLKVQQSQQTQFSQPQSPLLPQSTQQSISQPLPMSSSKPTQQQCLISDFSAMFKRNSDNFPKKPKLTQAKTPNWLLEIPAKLDITKQDLQTRRNMDIRKWNTVVKCNKNTNTNNGNNVNNINNQHSIENDHHIGNKLVAAVCSAWNYLCSEKGIDKNKSLTYKQAYQNISKSINPQNLINVEEHNRFNMISNIIQAFNKLNEQSPKLSCKICTKLANPNIIQQSIQTQKQKLLQKLQSSSKSHSSYFIYLAHNDIFVPIGFDITPLVQIQAYQKLQKLQPKNQQLWLICSTLGLNQPSFCIKRWSDIQKDLQTVWPNYFDIKEVKQGVLQRSDANQGNMTENRGTSNCIIQITFKQ